jgi:hypothetical protein
VGLSTNYQDWPGNTRIVIPLYDAAQGSLSAVDTSAISDPQVLESLREEDDKGIPAREQMADIKDREADVREQSAATAEQRAAEARQKADEEQQKLQAEQQKLTENLREAAGAKNAGDTAAESKQIAAEKQSGDTKLQADAAKAADIEAKQAETEAQAAREAADAKREEARSDREQIALDQGKTPEEAVAIAAAPPPAPAAPAAPPTPAAPEPVYGLRVLDAAGLVSAIVKLNAATGAVLGESPVKVVRGRTMFVVGKNFAALAGETGSGKSVKLVLIDSETLDIVSESAETVADNAVLMSDGKSFWTVINVNNAWVIGRFDPALKLLASSTTAVLPETAFTATTAGIIATGSDGRARVFKADTLAEL